MIFELHLMGFQFFLCYSTIFLTANPMASPISYRRVGVYRAISQAEKYNDNQTTWYRRLL